MPTNYSGDDNQPLGMTEELLSENPENQDEEICNGPFIHKESGEMYVLIGITNRAATREGWPVTACYVDRDGNLWSRPMSEFIERFDPYKAPDGTTFQ